MDQIAVKIRNAINSAAAQASLSISASILGQGNTDTAASNSEVVVLHGPAAITRTGSLTSPAINVVTWGDESGFGEDEGDANRLRDQGMVVISSTSFTNNQNVGVRIDAAARGPSGPSFPGAPINFPTNNADRLAPGVVVMNNIFAGNVNGGIIISGDAANPQNGNDVTVPSTVARVLNNTIFGTRNGDTGILVDQGATPVILNNIIANTATGINVATAGPKRVIGANLYQNNAANTNPANAAQSFEVIVTASPFVNAASGFFYPAPGSPAIDSSLEALDEVDTLNQIKTALKLPASPALAPDRDITGQRRVDDPSVNAPAGLGQNVFKDRGAVERADVARPSAVILRPQDNDSANTDIDRNVSYIRLQSGLLDAFSILLTDGEGVGPNPSTVTADSIVLTQNGRRLLPGVDYVFGYNANSRTVRLTPLAGIWRNDSVYEITLNNQDGFRLTLLDGTSMTNGGRITVQLASGGTRVFELNTTNPGGTNVWVPYTVSQSAYQIAAQLVTAINRQGNGLVAYLQGDGNLMIHGATSVTRTGFTNAAAVTIQSIGAIRDLAGNAIQANRANSLTQFTIVMPGVSLDYGDAIANPTVQTSNGPRHAILPVDAPLLVLGAIADGDSDGQPSNSNLADDNDSLVTLGSMPLVVATTGPVVLNLPAFTAALEGQQIRVTDSTVPDPLPNDVVFEFTTDATLTNASALPVTISNSATATQVASALGTAMRNAVLQGLLRRINPVVSGASVFMGGDTLYSVDLSLAANVQRGLSGDIRLTVPSSGLADGQTLSITDGNGRTLTFELNDTGAANQAVAGTNVRVDVTLATDTPDTIAQKLATAINGQVQARNLVLAPVTVSGSTIAILADDEDGVTFGGIFSPRANPVPVTVTSTGPGMLDAWFDWNGDGDFGDAGEQVIVSQPVQAGANVFTITTPNIASLFIGNINSRFRLSALGNLLTDGVGIGGEVEDHLVEVLGGTPPVAVANTYTVDEDVVLNVSAALGVLANDTDAENDPITVFDHGPTTAGIQPFVTTSNGVLVINADGSFTYTPNQDFFGTDTFVYFAADRRYTSNTPATVTITVNPINDRPTANADTITILEDAVTRLPGSTFWSNDVRGPANESGQTLRIVDAVIVGPTGIGGTVSVANDELVYNPPADYNNRINGPVLVRLTIRDGGVAGGDANPLEDSNTLTINLTQVNDAPIFTLPTSTSTIEDSGDVTVAGFVTGILPGNVTSTDEVTVDNQVVSFRVRAFNPTLFATQPAITNNGDGTATLTYRLAQDVNNNNRPITGADFRIEVIAVDNGRTLTGAYGTHAAPNDDESDPKIFTISVDARNDAPEFTLPDLRPSVIEDAGPRSVPNFATGIRAGTVRTDDEAATQTVSFTLTPVDPAAFKTLPAISPTGTLTYELAPEVNSAFKDLTVSVYLEDTGLNGGGNVNRSATQTFSIVAAQINDAPIFTLPTSTATFEDSGAITVPNFVTGILPGPALATDEVTVDNQVVTFRVRALDPSLFAVQPAITNNGNGTANLTYTLAPHVNDFNRPVTGANLRIEVVALDNGRTLTQYGAHNPPNDDESDPQTFAVSVEPRNDAPEFTLPNLTPTVDEDAGLRAVPGFATGVRPGPIAANDEVPQTVTFTLTARDPSAFKTLPAMTSTGLLTYELAADVNSRIKDLTVEVYLQDDGLNGGGHVNRSATQTFSIVAASINDAPIFTIPTTTSTFEDSGDLSVASFATGILPGPATATDEVTIDNQVVTFRVRALDPSLFAVQPTLTNNNNGTATLTYKLAPDVNNNNRPITGADLRVEVIAVDNGRTLAVYGTHAAPNDDESDPKTFTIDVSARNDAPEFTIPNTLPTVDEDAGPVTMSNFITNIRPGTVNSNDEAGQTLVFLVTAVDPTAFSTQPAITPAGVLTYQLATDVNSRFKNLTVQVALQDNGPNGSVAQGGAHVNTSATQSFSIVARHINDIPDFAIPEPSKTVLEDNEAETGVAITSFPGFAANIVRGPATALDEPGNQNVQFNVISVSNPALFETQPAISPTGTMTFKTKKDQNGSAVVVVQLQDSEIAVPTDSRVSVLRTFTINITPVNDAPEFTIPTTLAATEDQGLVLLNSFATDLRPGTTTSTDENTQTFTVAVAALDPSKFSVQPSLAADGTLQFRTAVDVNGPLPVTVVLTDDGPHRNADCTERQSLDCEDLHYQRGCGKRFATLYHSQSTVDSGRRS